MYFQEHNVNLNLRVKLMSSLEDFKIRFNDGKCDPQGRLWAGKFLDKSFLYFIWIRCNHVIMDRKLIFIIYFNH